MSKRHYVGDGCDPPHYLTVLAPEDPEAVRRRDKAYLNRDDHEEVTEHGESSG